MFLLGFCAPDLFEAAGGRDFVQDGVRPQSDPVLDPEPELSVELP